MTTIKTTKQIKDEYLMSSVDSKQQHYVSLQEYRALQQEKEDYLTRYVSAIFELETKNESLKIDIQWLQNQLVIDGHKPDCACVTASSVDCSCGSRDENEALKAILQQWVEASPGLVLLTSAQLEPTELKQLIDLIAATKTALGK